MSYANGPKIVTDGLVLCLDAGNSKSYPGTGTTWYDLSGNGNDLTLINGPTFTSSNGGGFIFDGVNDYAYRNIADCSSNFKSMSKWTAFVAMRHYETNTNWHQIMGFTDTQNFIDYWYRASTKYFHYNGGGGHDYTAVNLNNSGFSVWCHSIETGTNNSKFYRNGVLGDSYTPSYLNTVATTNGFSIAKAPENSLYHSNMLVSTVYIYNRVLTANEVQQNYNALKGRYGLN